MVSAELDVLVLVFFYAFGFDATRRYDTGLLAVPLRGVLWHRRPEVFGGSREMVTASVPRCIFAWYVRLACGLSSLTVPCHEREAAGVAIPAPSGRASDQLSLVSCVGCSFKAHWS